MGRSKRKASKKVRRAQTTRQRDGISEHPISAQDLSGGSNHGVLERIKFVRVARHEAEAELQVPVDRAVTLGIGWPEIASELALTRQAARQSYQRRHRLEPEA